MSVDSIARGLGARGTFLSGVMARAGKRKVVVMGDSISAVSTINTTGPAPRWWLMANVRLGGAFVISNVAAIDGRTIQDGDAGFATEVAPYAPDEIWLLLGRNNVDSVSAAVAGLVVLDSIIAKAAAIGAPLYVCTVTPGRGATYNTAAMQQALNVFNDGIMARYHAGSIRVVDMFSAIVDVADAASQGLAALIGADSLHPNELAHQRMGQHFAYVRDLYGDYTPQQTGGGRSITALRSAANPNSKNLIPNPGWQGSGGSGGTGITGTIPDNWAVGNSNAEFTCAVSRTTANENGRQISYLNLTLGGTLTAQRTMTLQAFAYDFTTSGIGITPGTDSVRASMLFKTSGLSATLACITLNAQAYDSGYGSAPLNKGWPQVGATAVAEWPAAGMLTWPATVIPANAVHPAIQLVITMNTGAATGVVSVALPSFELV